MIVSTATAERLVTRRQAALLAAWSPLSGGPEADDADVVVSALVDELRSDASMPRLWALAAATLGHFPDVHEAMRLSRNVVVYGVESGIRRLIDEALAAEPVLRTVRFVSDAVFIDVHDTSGTSRITGIQRVVRETVSRWVEHHEVVLVAWTNKESPAFRALADWERDGVLRLSDAEIDVDSDEVLTRSDVAEMIVPLSGTFVVTELSAELWRAACLRSLALYSGLATRAIGYDAVPMTSSETSIDGIAAQFPLFLQALAGFDRIGVISAAAGTEFRGWTRMLGSIGTSGPHIGVVDLAAEVPEFTPDDVAAARQTLGLVDGQKVVVVIGSHEPRKNHLAVIQAAKRLWASGLDFRLVFIGGGSWNSEIFHDEVVALEKAGRPLTLVSSAPDGILAAAYSLADFTVFPSLHEGFGLPVAESIALGTPVVTSNYGSMRDIIDGGGGGLLVDPRDDADVENAMRRLLTEPDTLAALAAEARARSPRTWDAYARDLWAYFRDGVEPKHA